MFYPVYNLATTLAAPAGAAYLALTRRRRPLLGRFSPALPPDLPEGSLWVQACSVGEVNAARPIVEAMRARRPDLPVLVTVSTVTGREQAAAALPGYPVTWFPFDHPACVSGFLRRARPRLLVLMETELWPNVVRLTRAAGVPVAVVNARLSDRHYPRYRRWSRALRPIFARLSAVCAQNDEYAGRFRALGAPPEAVRVTGCTKFDGVKTAVDPAESARLRGEIGAGGDDPLLVFGSTRPGDERLAAECLRRLRAAVPSLCLVVAPRHLDRVDEVLSVFDEPVLRRSELRAGRAPAGEKVILVDTMGELVSFYGAATVAVVGGSFYPGVNGHNPLEPAALGVPTVFGPYMRNFMDPARALLEADGAAEAPAEALAETLRGLLADPAARERMAARGRAAVLANQGAIGRTLDVLEALIGEPSRA